VCASDKASDTIHKLRHMLDREPVVGDVTDGRRGDRVEVVEHGDYSYGAAGERLRRILSDVTRTPPGKRVLFHEPAPRPHVT